ncbi:MAG: LPXTG cell wall anchor domain-containing protein [Lachnospiraceae bacterium]|nr:LPXTG cell wall anchor domain-containing protein [Lachnospiraceae bacterium]
MKRMKKWFAMLLALAMVLGMSVTAFADPTQGPAPAPATISGVYVEDEMPTVTAYQIIKYNDAGYYEEVLKDTITKISGTDGNKATLKPSSSDVQNLYYNRLNDLKDLNNEKVFTAQESNGEFTGTYTCGDLGLGTWLVVVSGSSKYLYNPAIISVSKTPEGLDYGRLNLETDTWNDETGTYLKRDEPTITKTAESADGKDLNVVGTQYGDILKYTITADIPAYTTERVNIAYSITDTIKGLDYVVDEKHPVSVKVGMDAESATEVDEAIRLKFENAMKSPKTVSEQTDKEPAVKKAVVNDLGDEFLVGHTNQKLIIEYYAQVTSTVLINVDRLNNKAELDYSNNDGSTNHKETETKHYTFGLDTTVTGWSESDSTHPTGEFVKINDKGDVEYTETPGEVITTQTDTKFLKGAEFQLHIGSADGALFTDKSGKNTFVTDENGRLQIVGLDDAVDYYLIETKAPEGYTLNTTAIKVRIEATYEEDPVTKLQDVLTSYKVLIGEGEGQQTVSHYKYDTVTGETEFINTPDTPSNPFGFKNTTLANLPSTGGIGTTIFTIAGCLIMIAAAGLFFVSRRKTAK